ncbi:MAG TPA: flagellar basal body-associated FliL family protein [Stellaceae bacterium]|nr:flagellar basal body-associated FliL family protein [Stellaceae bacterium]
MADRALDDAAEVPAMLPEGQAPAPAGGRKKLIIIVLGAVLLLAGAGGGLYFTGIVDKFLPHKAEVVDKAAAPAAPPVFFDMQDLLVNLNTVGRKQSFLKLSISLELERADDLPRLQAVMPRVIDTFQVYLRELRVDDLRGSAGIYRLREELLTRVNAAAAPVKVTDVLFKEMLVQ